MAWPNSTTYDLWDAADGENHFRSALRFVPPSLPSDLCRIRWPPTTRRSKSPSTDHVNLEVSSVSFTPLKRFPFFYYFLLFALLCLLNYVYWIHGFFWLMRIQIFYFGMPCALNLHVFSCFLRCWIRSLFRLRPFVSVIPFWFIFCVATTTRNPINLNL